MPRVRETAREGQGGSNVDDKTVRAAREAFLAAAKDFAENSSAGNFLAMEAAALALQEERNTRDERLARIRGWFARVDETAHYR